VDCLGAILAYMITPAATQDRGATKPLIKELVKCFGRLQSLGLWWLLERLSGLGEDIASFGKN
jgi:hypothetical protein